MQLAVNVIILKVNYILNKGKATMQNLVDNYHFEYLNLPEMRNFKLETTHFKCRPFETSIIKPVLALLQTLPFN